MDLKFGRLVDHPAHIIRELLVAQNGTGGTLLCVSGYHITQKVAVKTIQCVNIKGSWLREQDLNLRPSGYEPDELPGCSIPRHLSSFKRDTDEVFARFGGDLLSHVLRRSTIGATALNGRVRNGAGCFARAMTTKPSKNLNRSDLER